MNANAFNSLIQKVMSQIPQLKQVQYDASSQLYYVNQALTKLGLPTFNQKPALFSPDPQIENLLPTLTPIELNEELPSKETMSLAHAVANRLGLYDAADTIKYLTHYVRS